MTDITCPECDSELDDTCSDGLACPACRKFYPAYQVQQWIEEEFQRTVKHQDKETEDYECLDDGEEDPDLEDPDLEA